MVKPPVRSLKYKDGRLVGQNIEVCAHTLNGYIFWIFEYQRVNDKYIYNHRESVIRTRRNQLILRGERW